MSLFENRIRPAGLLAVEREMARQNAEALASYHRVKEMAVKIAISLSSTKKLLMLGMGGSHAVARIVEPLYRDRGIDTIALPLSEQLDQPLLTAGRTVFVTSQSGESAEVVRWFAETGGTEQTFGLTLEGGSALARSAPCLVGVGGTEHAYAATRSLTTTLALHLAILSALGKDPSNELEALSKPQEPDISPALTALAEVTAIVTSGRSLQGVAETLALGLTELSRMPCFSIEGGQFRHGPLEMLSPKTGIILFRGNDHTANLVTAIAQSVLESDSPLVLFDASGEPPVAGAINVTFRPANGFAAAFYMLPTAQRLMVAFAERHTVDAGTPLRSAKITRSE